MAAVNEDSHSEDEDNEDEFAAFQNRPKKQNSGAPQCSNRCSKLHCQEQHKEEWQILFIL